MDKNTKILLGLAAAGVVAYLVLKPKKAVAAKKFPNDFPDTGKILSNRYDNLDLSTLTQDASSPNLNKLVDKDGNTVFREGTGYTKFIAMNQGDTIIEYDLDGKFLNSSYDNGIRY